MNLLFGVEQDYHRPQKSPGAYEWWHFDGTDERSGYSFLIQFHAGNLFSAYYQDSLKTYWEKTKSPWVDPPSRPEAPNPSIPSGPPGQVPIPNPPAVSPPNPLDFCGVSFRLFHKGSLVVESFQEYSQKSLKASDKHGAVLLGPNRFNWDERGDPPSYVMTVQAPLRNGKTTVRARLFFTPLLKDKPVLPPPDIPSTHTWILAAPLCHVEGTIQWVDRQGEPGKELPFVGKGYHDHHFGSVPLDRFVTAWHWGRAFRGEGVLVYSAQSPVGEQGRTDGFWLTLGPGESRNGRESIRLSGSRRNFFWLPYSKGLETAGSDSIRVRHRQILGDGPVHLVFEDEARGGGQTPGVEGLSQYLYTPRLSSRFFFPLLKGKSLIVIPSEDDTLPPPSGDVSTNLRPIEKN